MVSGSLHDRGYNVWRVDSGAEALDLLLPDRNGLTLCSELKIAKVASDYLQRYAAEG